MRLYEAHPNEDDGYVAEPVAPEAAGSVSKAQVEAEVNTALAEVERMDPAETVATLQALDDELFKYAQRIARINDGLFKACGQLYEENKRLKFELALEQACHETTRQNYHKS